MKMSDELTTGQQNAVAQVVRAHEMEIARLQADLRTRESLRAEYLARAERAEALLAASREQATRERDGRDHAVSQLGASREQIAAVERRADGIEEKLTQRSRDLDDANARLRASKTRAEAAEREVTKLREALVEARQAIFYIHVAVVERNMRSEWAEDVYRHVCEGTAVCDAALSSPTTPAGDAQTAGYFDLIHPPSAPIEAPGKGDNNV
jgi:chromosome segregation ATPase